jgi:hypothetical protein
VSVLCGSILLYSPGEPCVNFTSYLSLICKKIGSNITLRELLWALTHKTWCQTVLRYCLYIKNSWRLKKTEDFWNEWYFLIYYFINIYQIQSDLACCEMFYSFPVRQMTTILLHIYISCSLVFARCQDIKYILEAKNIKYLDATIVMFLLSTLFTSLVIYLCKFWSRNIFVCKK